MAATKEAILAKEHEPDLDITIFIMDLRAFGKDFDRYAERAMAMGIRYVRAAISKTFEMPGSKNLSLVYAGSDMALVEEEFDMIVLSVGLEPSDSLKRQAKDLDIELNRFGFAATEGLNPLELSRPGVFVGGAFQEPKDIPDTVMQASAAAAKAMVLLSPARGTEIRKKQYPKERVNKDEPPRIGIFICHCGSNIASVVDVDEVVKSAWELPYVVFADQSVYTCADDSQDVIKKRIEEYRMNRVVIASCTPRTHEPIFRDTLKDAGLNPYLVEMANIRDQCSWVHGADPKSATDKAVDLVRMASARAALLQPLSEETVPIDNAALVIGGGIAGMTASLALADQGFPVNLVERNKYLGGTIRDIPTTLEGEDVRAYLEKTQAAVNAHPDITVHLNADVTEVDGHIGEFSSKVESEGKTAEVESGVVVVATGAKEATPTTYGYGESDQVLTQLTLSRRLKDGSVSIPEDGTVVMIQCVEQRTPDRPYCSRVCCATAVKNALILAERYPKARIVVLYRDMRTYGFKETAYRQAREKGVLFIRYDAEAPPELVQNGRLELTVREPALGRDLTLSPDLLVLAAPIEPRENREVVSELLKVPINADGFFLEAHMKLRPVDFASEGLFICGTAHAPKFISETISQAHAVAGRAATILSKKEMPVSAEVAWVDPNKCVACMTCVHVCPYAAPHVGKDNKAEIQSAVCMGCGSCTSECPAKAIRLHHYVDQQVLAAVDGLLAPEFEDKPIPSVYPEHVGIVTPQWKRGQ
jgi:heterodisulfide reductase subunit A